MNYKPHNYQNHGFRHVVKHEFSGLFLEMGLGKTVITLTAVNRFMYEDLSITKTLVIAPKRVAESVWSDEVAKWEHLDHLKLSIVLGTAAQRIKALQQPADIYVINRENVVWLVNYYQSRWTFDMLVIDELSSFKSPRAMRFKALRMVRPKVSRVIALTGTPAPNGLIDLWSQMYLIDQGERLGKSVVNYKQQYFFAERAAGHIVYKYGLRVGAQEEIHNRVKDICISMKSKDYLELPDVVESVIPIRLTKEVQARYEAFEESQVIKFADESEISAINAAALTNKLLQFANGAVYFDDGTYHVVHDEKIEALKEIIESSQGNTVLVAYSYRHDLDRILKAIPQARKLEKKSDVADWNEGKIPVLVAHPASAGHGLNLQDGGHIIVWFGPTWSLELYQQFNARLGRQGQKFKTFIYRIIVKKTMDEDTVIAIDRKATGQNDLMEAIKARIRKYKKT